MLGCPTTLYSSVFTLLEMVVGCDINSTARMGPVVLSKLKRHDQDQDQDQSPAPSNCYKIINNLGQPPKPKSTPILYTISYSFHYIQFLIPQLLYSVFIKKFLSYYFPQKKKKKKKIPQLIVCFFFIIFLEEYELKLPN